MTNDIPLINCQVLMSEAMYFSTTQAINPFMDSDSETSISVATKEHDNVRKSFTNAGIEVIQVASPAGCQDGIYTANWALVCGDTAIMARLPNARKAEESYARQILESLGKTIVDIPKGLKFSGQGDALVCGEYLFCGSVYRSDIDAQKFVADHLGLNRIQLQTKPILDTSGKPMTNSFSGWPDSYYYDLDLALSVLRPPTEDTKGLIAYCPDAFTAESQAILDNFDAFDKIIVNETEAKTSFACNLVSTGITVIMNRGADNFAQALRSYGLEVVELSNPEIGKGGGSIRCISLCLD